MAPLPLDVYTLFGNFGAYLIFLLIGFAFGYALEISGFGKSTKLAAQFYFKDLTVLKVMFTAIVVAMVLIFASTALGLLDYNLIWVNPTYLWPGIVGGLLMGVGFILGGFCPGTSLVALATLKIDGLFFALGVLTGIFIFGETVQYFELFWYSSYMGRFTLPEFFGVETGWVVLGVVLMALFMFWGGEQLEHIFGGKDLKKEPKWRYYGAGALVLGAVFVLLVGQPTIEDRWMAVSSEKQLALDARQVYIHPGELLHTLHDHKLKTVLLDVREEVDYNLFHLADAQRVALAEIPELSSDLALAESNTLIVVMSNDEARATEAWKILVADSVPNVYILEGGINNWLAIFGQDEQRIRSRQACNEEQLCYEFAAALGSAFPAADPIFHEWENALEYTPKIKLELRKGPTSGGCG